MITEWWGTAISSHHHDKEAPPWSLINAVCQIPTPGVHRKIFLSFDFTDGERSSISGSNIPPLESLRCALLDLK
jgi:hypothetical protein